MAEIVLGAFAEGITRFPASLERLAEVNPCGFDLMLNPQFYSYKIGTIWTGTFNANGRYIIVNFQIRFT